MKNLTATLIAAIAICSFAASADAGSGILGGVKTRPKGNLDVMAAPRVGGIQSKLPDGAITTPGKSPYKLPPRDASQFVGDVTIKTFTATRDGARIRLAARVVNLTNNRVHNLQWNIYRQMSGGIWTNIASQRISMTRGEEQQIDWEIPATNETVSLKFEIQATGRPTRSKLLVLPAKRTEFLVQYQTTDWLLTVKVIGRSETQTLREFGFEVFTDIRTQRAIVYGRALQGLSRKFGTRDEANIFRAELRSLFVDPVALQVRVTEI
jgi:hypothetical protein